MERLIQKLKYKLLEQEPYPNEFWFKKRHDLSTRDRRTILVKWWLSRIILKIARVSEMEFFSSRSAARFFPPFHPNCRCVMPWRES